MAMGYHLAIGAPVSDAPDEHLSTTTYESETIGIDTRTHLDGNQTDDNDNETTATSQLDSTMERAEEAGTAWPTGTPQEEAQGNSGEEEDEDLDPEVSFDSPRDQAVDRRCISAKLAERILSDSALADLAANTSVCRWRYEYDVDPRRVPELLMKAFCLGAPEGQTCGDVRYPIPVKRLNELGVWTSGTETLTVGCALIRSGGLREGQDMGDAGSDYSDSNQDDIDYGNNRDDDTARGANEGERHSDV